MLLRLFSNEVLVADSRMPGVAAVAGGGGPPVQPPFAMALAGIEE